MRYLSTVLIVLAMGGFVIGFSAYLRASTQMLDEAKLASAAAAAHARHRHHRRRHPAPVQAGAGEALPSMEEGQLLGE